MKAESVNVKSFLGGIDEAIKSIGEHAQARMVSIVPEGYRELVSESDMTRIEVVGALNGLVADEVGSDEMLKKLASMASRECPVAYSDSAIPEYSARNLDVGGEKDLGDDYDYTPGRHR